MPELSVKPGSSTGRQHRALVIAGRRRGFELNEIRAMVGGSIRRLSAADASECIKRLTGRDLPDEPGQRKSPYAERKKEPGVMRVIADDHVQQIARLGLTYFGGDAPAFVAWLSKNFKTGFRQCMSRSQLHELIRRLGTAERAGQVIRVLKNMSERIGRDLAFPSRDREGAETPGSRA